MSLDQEGFRWRLDDGSETGASWKEAQDTATSVALDTPLRLRILVDVQSDPAPDTSKWALYYKKSTDIVWREVTTGSPAGAIQLAASSNITAGGQDTTAQLVAPPGSPKSFATGRMWDDESAQDEVALADSQYTEFEFCISAVSAAGAGEGDIYDFRVMRIPGSGGADIARVDSGTISTNTDANGLISVTGIDVSGSNRLLLVQLTCDTAGDTAPTGTWDPTGAAQDLGTATEDNTTGQYQAVWVLVAPQGGTNLTCTVDAGLNNFPATLTVIALSNVNQATPTGTLDAVGTASGTSLSSNAITCAAGNWIVSFFALNGAGAGLAVAGGGTIIHSNTGAGAASAYAEDTEGVDDTVDWSWTSADRASAISFELKKAA